MKNALYYWPLWMGILWCCQKPVLAQQFSLTGDVRMRYEHRNGYAKPRIDSLKPGNFVVQRTRMSLDYIAGNLQVKLSPQSVRVWGESPSGAKSDVNGLQMYEAWLRYSVSPNFSIKAGRQELNYDDGRILGNADWNMQGRSHDAVVLNVLPGEKHTIHVGGALNAQKESNFTEPFTVKNQYNNMQYLWYKGSSHKLSWTFFLMNQGLNSPSRSEVEHNQTFMGQYGYAGRLLDFQMAASAQTGQLYGANLTAFWVMGKVGLKHLGKWKPEVGFELLSGKGQNDRTNDYKSYTPWYGTNHKFNGFMDYFYVGNHLNSTGLKDVYGRISYRPKKWKFELSIHSFWSDGALYRDKDKLKNHLGNELDYTVSYQVKPELSIQGGYSMMQITDSMIHLKGGEKRNNQWLYLSIHCKPEFFNQNKGQKSL
jgi:hypothetical protein